MSEHRPWVQWRDGPADVVLAMLADDDPATGALAWMDLAACAEVGDDFWFPEKGGSTRDAKQVCMGCEVRTECLEYALEHDLRFGIWGAKSERERREITRERRRQQAAA